MFSRRVGAAGGVTCPKHSRTPTRTAGSHCFTVPIRSAYKQLGGAPGVGRDGTGVAGAPRGASPAPDSSENTSGVSSTTPRREFRHDLRPVTRPPQPSTHPFRPIPVHPPLIDISPARPADGARRVPSPPQPTVCLASRVYV